MLRRPFLWIVVGVYMLSGLVGASAQDAGGSCTDIETRLNPEFVVTIQQYRLTLSESLARDNTSQTTLSKSLQQSTGSGFGISVSTPDPFGQVPELFLSGSGSVALESLIPVITGSIYIDTPLLSSPSTSPDIEDIAVSGEIPSIIGVKEIEVDEWLEIARPNGNSAFVRTDRIVLTWLG